MENIEENILMSTDSLFDFQSQQNILTSVCVPNIILNWKQIYDHNYKNVFYFFTMLVLAFEFILKW